MADLYLIINFFFVFASLIEFALVSYEPPVKTMAKSWLHSTREKLKTKASTDTKSGSEGYTRANNMSRLIPDLHKLETSNSNSNSESPNLKIMEMNGNGGKKPVKNFMPSSNGCVTTGVDSHNSSVALPFRKDSARGILAQPKPKGSPLSLRQAILRREKLLEQKESRDSDSMNELSDADSFASNKFVDKPIKLQKTQPINAKSDKSNKDSMNLALPPPKYETTSSTSPLLPSFRLGNQSPILSKKREGPIVYSGTATDDFLEIVDCRGFPGLKKDLYSTTAVKNRKPVVYQTKSNSAGGENSSNAVDDTVTPSLEMQNKPLQAVIKMDKMQKHPAKNQNSKIKKRLNTFHCIVCEL